MGEWVELGNVLQDLLKLGSFLLDHVQEVDLEIPLFVGLRAGVVVLPALGEGVDEEGVECDLGGVDGDVFEGLLAIPGVEVALLGVVVGEGLGTALVVVLLEGVDELPGECVPDVDALVEGGSHEDALLLDELEHLDCLVVGLDLPLEVDGGAVEDVLDEVPALELDLLLAQLAVLQLQEQLLVVVAAQVHLIVHHVQQSVPLVEAAQPHAHSASLLLAVSVLEPQQPLEPEGKRRDSNQHDSAVGGGHNDDFLAGLADGGELFGCVLHVGAHALACFDVEEGEGARIGAHHDELVVDAVLEGSDFDVLLQVDGAHHFKRLLRLPTDADLIVQAAADEDVHFGVDLLGGDQVGDLPCVASQVLHLGAVGSVVQGDVALGVSDYHPLPQVIEVEGRDLEGGDVHVDLLYVSVEGAPHLHLVACRREEAQRILDVPARDDCVLIGSERVVVLVVVVEAYGFACEDEPEDLLGRLVDGDEVGDCALVGVACLCVH